MLNTAASSTGMRIRPIRIGDRDELSRFYARLSPDSRLARFLAVSRGIGEDASVLLCRPDHEHREGFVAEPLDADQDVPGIVGHICVEPGEFGVMEMAVAVADEWQRQGIGRALLLAVVEWARDHGIGLVQASMLATNSGVLALIASIGRPVHEAAPYGGVVLVTIDVGRPMPKAA
jgi:acetyltransferase